MTTGFINVELEPLLNDVFVRTKKGEVIHLKTIPCMCISV